MTVGGTTPGEAEKLLANLWGVEATARPLPGELDDNFLVVEPDGARSVLKLMHPDASQSRVDMQIAALAHLEARGMAGRVPSVVSCRDGRSMARVEDPGGRERLVWRLTWIEGPLLASVEARSPALAASLGGWLGRLDRALQDFEHPAADLVHAWDPSAAGDLASRIRVIDDSDTLSLLETVVGRWHTRVAPALSELPRQVIHADANDHNVVVDEGPASRSVTGVFDFGDMVRTVRVAEPAIAATYAAFGAPDPVGVIARLVAAYHVEHPLIEAELELVAPLIEARLAISLSVSAARRLERPNDPYVTISEAPARRLLRVMARVGPDHVARRIRETMADPTAAEACPAPEPDALLARRRAVLGSGLSLSYRRPLHLVQGRAQYLEDHAGRRYADFYNNVAHVGHAHPRVAEAIARQSAVLATNTRYLDRTLIEYVERLLATLPDRLEMAWILNSASEANELALRLARVHTGRREVIVVEDGYHGHTTGLIDVSPYKFDGPGGAGRPDHVRTVPAPDGYRGPHRGAAGVELGRRYADEAGHAIAAFEAEGRAPGAFLAETFPSVAGQIVPPPGWLAGIYRRVRAAGGICIADEVQTGLGRLGDAFWGFTLQDVVPDVVVLGKPAGNGFPLAAVVTTREIARSFDTGMEFFSTFGGNPVACAAGLAVLDVIEDEALQAHAARVGTRLLEGLSALASEHPRLAHVRGHGLFVGVQLVADPESRAPAPRLAEHVVEGLLARGFLTGRDGPHADVLKLRGPLVLAEADVERLLDALSAILSADDLPAG